MHHLIVFGFFVALSQAQDYNLQSAFAGGPSFLDNFDFWTSWDPTFGYVHYIDRSAAEQHSMINVTDSTVSWGVDTTQVLDPSANLGRLSIRLTSHQSWTHGLFILDLAHMPDGTCGVWPSFWSLSSTGTWPSSGEIDIIEFVNKAPNNLMALHTSPNCSVAGADQTGTLLTSDCSEGNGETGCTVDTTAANNVATSFNANGGGVYAMEWTSIAIRIWFFPRGAIPQSITSGAPDVKSFGTPAANFQGSCDIDAHFSNHNLIFNTDFCGQWAGPLFHTDGCPALEPDNSWQSCNDFVALNPGAFVDTYWEVNYLHVYQTTPGVASPTTSSLSSVVPAISTSSVDTALSNAQGRSSTPTQSIAATVPTAVTGSFTATSSVLSVLSSLSVSSSIASSESAGLAGREASSSSLSASSQSPASSSWAFTFSLTASTLIVSTTAVPSLSVPTSSSTSSSSSCTEATCTSYVVVVETITVPAAAAQLEGRDVTTQTSSATTTPSPTSILSTFNRLGNCEFTIPGHSNPMTDYTCTFSELEVQNGTLLTNHITVSTTLSAEDPLQIGAALDIDHIVVKTEGLTAATSLQDVAFTGIFNASTTSTASTTITARPVIDPSDVVAPLTLAPRDAVFSGSIALTQALHVPRKKKPKHMSGGQISFCGVPGQFCEEFSLSTVDGGEATVTLTLSDGSYSTPTTSLTLEVLPAAVDEPTIMQPSMAVPDMIEAASSDDADEDVTKRAPMLFPNQHRQSTATSASSLLTPSSTLKAATSGTTMVWASSLATPLSSSSGETMVSASSLATASLNSASSSSGAASTMASASTLSTPTPSLRRQAIKKQSVADGYCSTSQSLSTHSRATITYTFSEGSPAITMYSFMTEVTTQIITISAAPPESDSPLTSSTELRRESASSTTSATAGTTTQTYNAATTLSTHAEPTGEPVPSTNQALSSKAPRKLFVVAIGAAGVVGLL